MTHSYGRNGAAAILKSLLRYWARDLGWSVDAVVEDQVSADQAEALRSIGVRPVGRVVGKGQHDFALVNTAIDLHHVPTLSGVMPVVLWVHEGMTLVRNIPMSAAEMIRLFALPRRVVFQTQWQVDSVFRSFIHELPQERIAVVPCGIEAAGQSFRVPLRETPDEVFRVVCIGSVYGRKRQMDLARAVVEIAKRRRIECFFIGDLDHVATFGDDARSLLNDHRGTLHWLGGVDDATKSRVLDQSDIACFPSGDETFGIAALEAGLRGLPVVLADLPPYRDVGWRHADNCLVHRVRDVAALGACIESLMDSRTLRARIAIGANALARQYPMDPFLARMTAVVSRLD